MPQSLSVVVPVFNEEENLPLLHAEIAEHVGGLGRDWEVVYVDDRSTDASLGVLRALRAADEHVKILRLRRNFGQTAALAAGFEASRGEVVVTLDADLQNDPADVPRLLAEIDAGSDVVVGWRKTRRDGLVLRRLPSIVANRLIGLATGVRIHDTGCTLKAFRRPVVEKLPIYAEQHRFLPVLASAGGARLAELVVNHRPRRFGRSKYGIGRTMRVLSDLFAIVLVGSFSRRPLRYFALLAAPCALGALVVLVTGLGNYGNLARGSHWGQAVLLTCMLLAMACVYFLSLGLLAELAIKVHASEAFGPLVEENVP